LTTFLWIAILSFLPISELRGAIPFAIVQGVPWYYAYPLSVLFNILVSPVCWIFLSTLHKLLFTVHWYRNIFNCFVERTRRKLGSSVEKWEWFGIVLFVAIPLPLTGAWTGTFGAWLFGISKRQTLLAIMLGVVISGAIVTFIAVVLKHSV
jgi:uncharacterized membrane protein